ncbi:MAG: hypothetical protein M3Z17_08140 [Gemmatimonadota bacterium]|nr:hypothetical protein [Gemmatimonadota bacterium]
MRIHRNFLAAVTLFAPLSALCAQGSPIAAATTAPPGVDVWFERTSYQTFDKATVYFAAESGSYVVVVRVAPRGTLQVLYPASPTTQQPYRVTAEARTPLVFRNDGIEGLGEISAISSSVPFDFSKVSDGTKWSSRRLAHPRAGLEGSLSSGFFDDISGSAGTRYGIASTVYGVGVVASGAALADGSTPTAEEALRSTSRMCGQLGRDVPPSNDPACVSAYMKTMDPKPKLGGKPATTGGASTESKPVPAKN